MRFALSLCLPFLLAAGLASAGPNVTYAYAEVLRADPVYDRQRVARPREECSEETVIRRGGEGRRAGGAVVGAIIGGAVGNQVGRGSGRRAATAAGVVAGAVIGSQVAGAEEEARETVERHCRIVEEWVEEQRIVGYDVEYRYRGQLYLSRLPYDPGERLRIRITVEPAD
jgi:uncharacterized protein YcfJ